MHTSFINNVVWAKALLESLRASGVTDFCVAPGSRSAPLAMALNELAQRDPQVAMHTHFDERGLGFFAMSLSRSRGEPVVVITTSGTAVANLYPAVIEAWESCVPLVLLTADRPDYLIHCGANQAIEQKHLFQNHVIHSHNFTLPHSQEMLRQQQKALVTVKSAFRPIHFNCQFDEPLYPENDHPSATAVLGVDDRGDIPAATSQDDLIRELNQHLESSRRTLFVLGGLLPRQAAILAPWLARADGLVFADINSQFRFSGFDNQLHLLDVSLLNPQFIAAFNPDCIVQFGGRLVSKRVNQFLASAEAYYWLVSEREINLDPSRRARRLTLPLPDFGTQVSPALSRWEAKSVVLQNHESIAELVRTNLSVQWHEASIACTVASELTTQDAIFVGNSLAIRMLDSWLPQLDIKPAVFSNRGASGIDGLLASAVALSHGTCRQVVVLLGDTSLLHDLNSLALLRKARKPIKIVVLNNDGGRIFGMLPAGEQTAYESLFAMPPGQSDFLNVARQFSLAYFCATEHGSLRAVLGTVLSSPEHALLECKIDGDAGVERIKLLMTRLQCLKI
ncbi:2-succinyl-5-enolpyruvyl-6-hydroxy-3-cyclohexene-1-carboxylic-acid synthase [Teredinibacter turnerae]|uniref:2-succinyl-5-enolpyruvyl-6-hydroxy-3- cyclohexene-1-carboxylic-acid synthase n=1 Tax=Teredinibacter turnerae TaxID=2426 RepID=UPI0003605F75|nr:2-succinyl-5-enolpyruvyl-6-hydroxy-3-cyclohexene-1-carboxylic-acid synthase [Teredinibacter turnerae]